MMNDSRLPRGIPTRHVTILIMFTMCVELEVVEGESRVGGLRRGCCATKGFGLDKRLAHDIRELSHRHENKNIGETNQKPRTRTVAGIPECNSRWASHPTMAGQHSPPSLPAQALVPTLRYLSETAYIHRPAQSAPPKAKCQRRDLTRAPRWICAKSRLDITVLLPSGKTCILNNCT